MDGGDTIDPEGYIKSRGLKLPKDRGYLTRRVSRLLRANRYERALTDAALRATRDGDTVLDLGCGLGFVSGVLAKRRNLAAIHAYDGNATLLTYAEAMLATNGIKNVTLTHAVLGKRKSKVPFFTRPAFSASSLAPDTNEQTQESRVQMHNLKTTLSTLKPTVVICDIEGGEADLLSGASLNGVRHLVIKLHSDHIGHSGLRDVFGSVTAAGLAYDPRISNGRIVGFVAA